MASRSWNRIELIGNLTRDPELRYTSSSTPVATFGLATNRIYVSDGEKKEETDFHRIVAWGKLAELCQQLLKKGIKVFLSGRLTYREWEGQDGQKRRDAEIILEDMILLSPKGTSEPLGIAEEIVTTEPTESQKLSVPEELEESPEIKKPEAEEKKTSKKSEGIITTEDKKADETVDESDLPF